MVQTATDLPLAAMDTYQRTAWARARARQEQLEVRRARAWAVARRAAAALKDEFGARQVALFGSLVRPTGFHPGSDVDLAVWGLDERLVSTQPTLPQVVWTAFQEGLPSIRAVSHRESVPNLREGEQYFRAVAHLLDLDPSIEVDLVEVEQARPALQAVIRREGVLL